MSNLALRTQIPQFNRLTSAAFVRALAIVSLLAGFLAPEIEASEPIITVQPQAAPSCNGNSCNYEDPVSQGCTADAVTTAEKEIRDEWTNDLLGSVRMQYSANCNAQWGEVYNNGTLQYSKVALRSTDGLCTHSWPMYWSNTKIVRTTMLATPNDGYRADGGIDACIDGCDSGGYSWVIW